MRPVLLELFGRPVPSYAAATFLATAVCLTLAARLRPRRLLSFGNVVDVHLLAAVGALVGGRLAFRVLHGDPDGGGLGALLRLWEPGAMSSLGIPVVVVPSLLLYCRVKRLSTAAVLDYLVPFAVLAAAVQRGFGCFLAGCCAGRPTASWFGVIFPGREHLGAVHPTQLYLALCLLVLFATLLRWRSPAPGVKTCFATAAYAVINAAVAPLRSATVAGRWPGLPAPVWIYLAVAVVSVVGAALLLADYRRSGSGRGTVESQRSPSSTHRR